MKHELIDKKPVGIDLFEIKVRLIPETEPQIKAVRNFEIGKANEEENKLINDYLLFGITGWSTLSINSQKGNVFKLRATNA